MGGFEGMGEGFGLVLGFCILFFWDLLVFELLENDFEIFC